MTFSFLRRRNNFILFFIKFFNRIFLALFYRKTWSPFSWWSSQSRCAQEFYQWASFYTRTVTWETFGILWILSLSLQRKSNQPLGTYLINFLIHKKGQSEDGEILSLFVFFSADFSQCWCLRDPKTASTWTHSGLSGKVIFF